MSSWKWAIIGLVIFICGLIYFENVSKKYLDDRPELKLSQSFLESNAIVREDFGDITRIRFERKYSRIDFNDGRTSGEYAFRIEGVKKSEIVGLKWRANASQFEPEEIELIFKYKSPQIIWISQ